MFERERACDTRKRPGQRTKFSANAFLVFLMSESGVLERETVENVENASQEYCLNREAYGTMLVWRCVPHARANYGGVPNGVLPTSTDTRRSWTAW